MNVNTNIMPFIYFRYIMYSEHDQLPAGLIAQLVEDCMHLTEFRFSGFLFVTGWGTGLTNVTTILLLWKVNFLIVQS